MSSDTPFDSRGKLKLNLIAPYRNTRVIDEEFDWYTNSIKLKGRFEALDDPNVELETPGSNIYDVRFSDYFRQRLQFANFDTLYRCVHAFTYRMLFQENVLGSMIVPPRIVTGKRTS